MLGALYVPHVDQGLGVIAEGLTHRELRVLAGGSTLQALPSAQGSHPVALPRGSQHPMTDWSGWAPLPHGASAAFRAP